MKEGFSLHYMLTFFHSVQLTVNAQLESEACSAWLASQIKRETVDTLKSIKTEELPRVCAKKLSLTHPPQKK